MNEMVKGNVKKMFPRLLALVMVVCAFAAPCFAAEANPVTVSDFQSVLDALTAQISVATVVGIISAAVTASVGLAFMWWGVRKLTGALMAAFRKGKVSV